jgi:hypothetical protein
VHYEVEEDRTDFLLRARRVALAIDEAFDLGERVFRKHCGCFVHLA